MKTFFFPMMLFCSVLSFGQNTLTVDNNASAGAEYTSVQAAINAASSGDTILIHPSPNSYGNITINKTLHLRGLGHYPELNAGERATLGNIELEGIIGAPNTSISGLVFGTIQTGNNQNYSGLSLTNNFFGRVEGSNTAGMSNNWLIAGNRISMSMFELIDKGVNTNNWMIINNYIHQPSASESWTIVHGLNSSDVFRNNIIVSNQNGTLVSVFSNCQNLTAENNIILFTGTATGINTSSNSITFNKNLTYSYPGQTLNLLNGIDNLDNTNPQFVNIGDLPTFSYSKDFNLSDGSPAAGHGTDGQDLGIYGNSFNFSMNGYPSDMPYPTSMVITNASVENGGTLNVQFQAVGN